MTSTEKMIDRLREKARVKWAKLTNEDFDAIKTDAGELATRLQARYGIAADDAKRQADEFVREIGDVATEAYGEAEVKLEGAAHSIDRIVKDNAWMSVCGVFLLGGVVGYLIGSDNRRYRW